MKKRGQMTIFIIMAIMIVFIAALYFFINPINNEKPIPVEVAPINSHIQECVEQTAENAVYWLGTQGGSLIIDGDELITPDFEIDYLYYKGINKVPSIENMEDDFSLYMNTMIDLCLNFSAFPDYEFSFGEANTKTTIKNNEIDFEVNYPLTIEKENSTIRIEDFHTAVPVRLKHIREIANTIVESNVKNDPWIDTSLFSEFDVNIIIHPYGDDLIYEIVDEKSKVYGKPFKFLFANKFIGEENEKED